MKIESEEQLRAALDRVSFRPSCLDMGWQWRVLTVLPAEHYEENGDGWLISCSFQRPDTQTGAIGRGSGRWEFVARFSTISAVVKTAWVCVEKVVYHELLEAFCFDGNRVFDPHKSVFELAMPRKNGG